ncbi:hypothetical protein SLOPH_823 [Spraguea lophii 42_110]|uniref:Uncharacterized protein n=1 Tax=Spraguea lophii (strain 42_110) TaxID=1358809 RepID=S7XJU8_SPRLO|nr:hypothetical protein SLOPH_823 [Spraguea lophii 42_110]
MSEEYTELLDRAIEGEILIEGTRLYNEGLKGIYNIQKELINTHDIEKKKKLELEIVSRMKETYNNRAKLCKESQQLVGNPEFLRSEINRLERLSK